MIMKEYSAVVMKLMHIWLTDKLHALISVLLIANLACQMSRM